ncbi:MAG: hypothetical protein OXL37_11465 [Chloroflexota bacterium]|nr:hypothetical protein [Chloroflexota bacterium]MDE2960504.1 hypothetical protein [Chloroflexota bacterium]
MTPYIGITGFCSRSEVDAVLAALPANPNRQLMCGALLSNALLSGEPSDAPNRCPAPDAIAGIFSDDPRCLNLVHYRPPPGANLADALARATEVGGPHCHGVQINATRGAPWPDLDALAAYRECCRPSRIVFQAGREAMESVNHRPDELARRCATYSGLVTDVLVDASEGLGLSLDAARSADYLEALRAAAPELGLVVAGGLHSGNISELLSPLLPEWSGVSIDAEGRLRDADDHLNTSAAIAYLQAASQLLD